MNASLARRMRMPEVMDDPHLDCERHAAALAGLARLNAASASARIVWSAIERLARDLGTDSLRVLDVATGGGDIPRALWRRGEKSRLHLELHGIDISERAVRIARAAAEARGMPIGFSQHDVLAAELPPGFDVVVSSLFLHHLDDEDAAALLAKMARSARHLLLVNDLRRCRRGLWLAHVAGRLLTRSDVVHVDAPRSVRAAFTIEEVRQLAALAGLEGTVVRPRWPFRFLLAWRRGPSAGG